MIPPAKRGWRPRDVSVREILNAIFYLLSTSCKWQALPKDLPPKSTPHCYFALWESSEVPIPALSCHRRHDGQTVPHAALIGEIVARSLEPCLSFAADSRNRRSSGQCGVEHFNRAIEYHR
jgi:transposase